MTRRFEDELAHIALAGTVILFITLYLLIPQQTADSKEKNTSIPIIYIIKFRFMHFTFLWVSFLLLSRTDKRTPLSQSTN